MQVLGFIIAMLLEVRAHIPNQPSFGSGPARATYGVSAIRAIAAFVVVLALMLAAIWLAVRLTMEFL